MGATLLYKQPVPEGPAQLVVFTPKGESRRFEIDGTKSSFTIGKNTKSVTNDIDLASPIVSRHHGMIEMFNGHYLYRDQGSLNGSFINGTLYGGQDINGEKKGELSAKRLENGDAIRIDQRNLHYAHPDARLMLFLAGTDELTWKRIPFDETTGDIEIGRESGDMQFADKAISAKHATFRRGVRGWTVIDHNSTNGVYVNNERIEEPTPLDVLDVIRIANVSFILLEDRFLYNEEILSEEEPEEVQEPAELPAVEEETVPAERIEAPVQAAEVFVAEEEERTVFAGRIGMMHTAAPAPEIVQPAVPTPVEQKPVEKESAPAEKKPSGNHLHIAIKKREVRNMFKKKVLLQDIDMDIQGGEMVLILGGSGAGKTTFLNAVLGYEKADAVIELSDVDMYKNYSQLKGQIGFVPQKDLVRDTDNVYDTIDNAARMRMPVGTSAEDRKKRVEDVLEAVALGRERKSMVKSLSGGQKKRLSIAVELVADPTLFFLDEPDSGLDGITATKLMKLLRTIADEGKIVMVITHQPDRVSTLFDKVVVLAKSVETNSGQLAFFGSVNDAFAFFETNALESIVQRINRKDEGGDGLSDFYIQKYKASKQQ